MQQKKWSIPRYLRGVCLLRPALTKRENEIARLAAQGLSNKEIGKRLYISENTVKTQIQSVFGKLGINSRRLLSQELDV